MPTQLQSLEPRRLFAAGDPLETFGHHGEAFTPYELYEAEMSEVQATPAGKLLASVDAQYYRATQPGVPADFIQFKADGSPDPTFGGTGYIDTFFSSVRRITVCPDGKFYALGTTAVPQQTDYGANPSSVAGSADWFVARFLPSGKLDRSFGTRGRVAIHLDRTLGEAGNPGDSGNTSSYLDTEGRLTLLADYKPDPKSNVVGSAVFRYDATGHFDSTFNGGQPLRLQSTDDQWNDPSMTVAGNGDVLVTAVRTFRQRASTIVKRFKADGSADTSFGKNGLATVTKTASAVPTVAAAADGSVFVSGNQYWWTNGDYQNAQHVYKLKPDGSPDTAFSGGSVQLGTLDGFDPLLPLPDGGVVLGSEFESMQRFHADGTPDAAFGKVDAGSRMPVIANNTIYALTVDAAYQVNKRGQPVYRHAVTALSLGGTGHSPIKLSDKHLTLTGTSDSESITIDSLGAWASPVGVQLTIERGFWTRTVPLSAVKSITIYGEGGDDDIRAFMDDVTGVSVVMHGGPGNDGLGGWGSNILAYGDAGDDNVWGDISVDRDFP